MEEFEDIRSLNVFLEENALKYKYSHQISDLFRVLRDKLKDEKESDVERAQWEIDFFNFVLKDGEISPSFQSTDDKGEIIEYPHFNRFNESTYDYLIERYNFTNNILLKARYAHILWFSPRKNGKFAQSAIDSYLELTEIYEEKDRGFPNEHYGQYALSAIKNAFFISRQANDNHRIEITKNKIISLIYYYNEKSTSLLSIKFDLIELIIENKNIFNEKDLISFKDLCNSVGLSLFQSGNGFRAISFFELGEKIDNKLKIKTHQWSKSIGECFEMMMNQREEEPLVAIDFCQNAIEYYKKSKNNSKIEELEIQYKKLKGSLKLESFKYEIDQTEYIKSIKIYLEEVVKSNSSDNIIGYLALNKNLLPKYTDMEVQSEQQSKDHPLLDIFPQVILDHNAHTAQKITKENIKEYKIMQNYKTYLEVSKLPKINYLLFESVKQKKLSPQLMLNFLKKYSWIGINRSRKLPNEDIFEYNWLNLLAPSLNEYFLQINYYLYSNSYPNFVLAIDSLTLKIEGILRDYCDNVGIITSFQRSDKNGTNIRREKDLNALLHEQKLADHFYF